MEEFYQPESGQDDGLRSVRSREAVEKNKGGEEESFNFELYPLKS